MSLSLRFARSAFFAAIACAVGGAGDRTAAVVAYLPEWRFHAVNWGAVCTHVSHLILFRCARPAAFFPRWGFAHRAGARACSAEVGPEGCLLALDRLPAGGALAEARAAARSAGTALLLCVGGNGRSGGFGAMVRSVPARKRFVAGLVAALLERGLDGVDYNWEYPGYAFGTGYARAHSGRHSPRRANATRARPGAAQVCEGGRRACGVRGARAAAARDARRDRRLGAPPHARDARVLPRRPPSGFEASRSFTCILFGARMHACCAQEALLVSSGAANASDMVHAMAYDAGGAGGHSPVSLARAALDGAAAAALPLGRMTLGLPFYARVAGGGDWKTYEEVLRDWPRAVEDDAATDAAGATWTFNGPSTIARKTEMALDAGARGVMIWEVGQDCRLGEVTRGGAVHSATCGSDPASASLLHAVSRGLRARGVALERYWADAGGGSDRDVKGGGGAPAEAEL